MELWIRSQDRKDLINASEYLSIEETNFSADIEYVIEHNKRPFFIECSNCILGFYATKERALEVMDEISNKIRNQFIVKSNALLRPLELMKEKKFLEAQYNGDYIIEDKTFEITPVNSGIIYYEMPEE